MKKHACLGCEERQVGCHSTCPRYLAIKAERDKEYLERRKEARAEADIEDFKFKSVERMMRRKSL
jgi:hypothetical protein